MYSTVPVVSSIGSVTTYLRTPGSWGSENSMILWKAERVWKCLEESARWDGVRSYFHSGFPVLADKSCGGNDGWHTGNWFIGGTKDARNAVSLPVDKWFWYRAPRSVTVPSSEHEFRADDDFHREYMSFELFTGTPDCLSSSLNSILDPVVYLQKHAKLPDTYISI